MVMAERVAKSKARGFFVDAELPSAEHRRDADAGRAAGDRGDRRAPEIWTLQQVFGAIFQYPGTYGHLADPSDAIAALHGEKAWRSWRPIFWR
jgi:glycine dehydrogenase